MTEEELQAQLSALPSPPMPDDVTAAITAALAGQAASDADGGADVVPLTPGIVVGSVVCSWRPLSPGS